MRYEEYAYNASEINQLEHILGQLPDERVIERMGLQHRLAMAKERIEGIPIPPIPQKVYITFHGKPVLDEFGIDANFGADALNLFTDAIAMTMASFAGNLEARGAIPNRGLGQQIITGVATGSFGFELELPAPPGISQRDHQVADQIEDAVERIQDLLSTSYQGSDNELSEVADDMHPRTVRKVNEFLDLLRRNDARFALNFKGREFRIRNNSQLEYTAKRLRTQNIHEETNTIPATIIGIIPVARRFQMNRLDNGTAIEGKLGREIRNPYNLAKEYTNKQVTAEIRSVRVGQGTPRYTLVWVSEPT